MKIIQISALDNGAHRNQTVPGTRSTLPDGWAMIPEEMDIPNSFPFVDVETDGAGNVTKLAPRDVPVDLSPLKDEKITELSAACNAAIVAGVDVEVSTGETEHFSLTLEDQVNLMNLQSMVLSGSESVPYHADGQSCRMYSGTDLTAIATAATNWKLYQESYFNSLRAWVRSMETAEEVRAVEYGTEIPEEFQSDVLKALG